jgi:pimeloyl-ACP methyl ester carboxylesterase
MTRPLRIIYILGLGDYRQLQNVNKVIKWWGVESEIFRVNWGDGKPWDPKFKKLLKLVDRLSRQGNDVAIVGASAGATAAINAFAARKNKIVGIVLVAGKINRPQTISGRYAKQDFITSAHRSARALATLSEADRRRVLSRYALLDGVVAKRDSLIPGARNRMAPTIGHGLTIATQFVLGPPGFIRFFKRLQQTEK